MAEETHWLMDLLLVDSWVKVWIALFGLVLLYQFAYGDPSKVLRWFPYAVGAVVLALLVLVVTRFPALLPLLAVVLLSLGLRMLARMRSHERAADMARRPKAQN